MSSSSPDSAENPRPARELREALRRLVLAHGALDGTRRPCGTRLTTPHAWALLELLEGGPMTVSRLASRLNIDRTNVSRLCARMDSLGELERTPHADDGRARVVQLTDAGIGLARAVDTASSAHFEQVLTRLDADAASIVAALDSLTEALPSRGPQTPESPT